MICVILTIILIASAVAFYVLISLSMIFLYISYFISILFIMIWKLQDKHSKYDSFKLDCWKILINLFAFFYILFVLDFVILSSFRSVIKKNMNYAELLIIAVALLTLTDYVISSHCWFQVSVLSVLWESLYSTDEIE